MLPFPLAMNVKTTGGGISSRELVARKSVPLPTQYIIKKKPSTIVDRVELVEALNGKDGYKKVATCLKYLEKNVTSDIIMNEAWDVIKVHLFCQDLTFKQISEESVTRLESSREKVDKLKAALESSLKKNIELNDNLSDLIQTNQELELENNHLSSRLSQATGQISKLRRDLIDSFDLMQEAQN